MFLHLTRCINPVRRTNSVTGIHKRTAFGATNSSPMRALGPINTYTHPTKAKKTGHGNKSSRISQPNSLKTPKFTCISPRLRHQTIEEQHLREFLTKGGRIEFNQTTPITHEPRIAHCARARAHPGNRTRFLSPHTYLEGKHGPEDAFPGRFTRAGYRSPRDAIDAQAGGEPGDGAAMTEGRRRRRRSVGVRSLYT